MSTPTHVETLGTKHQRRVEKLSARPVESSSAAAVPGRVMQAPRPRIMIYPVLLVVDITCPTPRFSGRSTRLAN